MGWDCAGIMSHTQDISFVFYCCVSNWKNIIIKIFHLLVFWGGRREEVVGNKFWFLFLPQKKSGVFMALIRVFCFSDAIVCVWIIAKLHDIIVIFVRINVSFLLFLVLVLLVMFLARTYSAIGSIDRPSQVNGKFGNTMRTLQKKTYFMPAILENNVER